MRRLLILLRLAYAYSLGVLIASRYAGPPLDEWQILLLLLFLCGFTVADGIRTFRMFRRGRP